MKPSTIPMICGVALAAMSAAGFSHWWSVNSFVAAVDSGLPIAAPPAQPAAKPAETPAPEATSHPRLWPAVTPKATRSS